MPANAFCADHSCIVASLTDSSAGALWQAGAHARSSAYPVVRPVPQRSSTCAPAPSRRGRRDDQGSRPSVGFAGGAARNGHLYLARRRDQGCGHSSCPLQDGVRPRRRPKPLASRVRRPSSSMTSPATRGYVGKDAAMLPTTSMTAPNFPKTSRQLPASQWDNSGLREVSDVTRGGRPTTDPRQNRRSQAWGGWDSNPRPRDYESFHSQCAELRLLRPLTTTSRPQHALQTRASPR
jgi:hypothetical protein